MKVACDFCEKVKDRDSREVKDDWDYFRISESEYLICEKCSKKMFRFIDLCKNGYCAAEE